MRTLRLRLMWESAEFAREPVPPALLYCHGDDPALLAAEQLRRGRELFASLRCVACHTDISASQVGVASANVSGDPPTTAAADDDARRGLPELLAAAPNLAGVARLQGSWITNWIVDPKARHADARMPRMNVSSHEAADIALWLETETTRVAETPAGGDIVAGAMSYEELGCVGCHRLANEGSDAYRRRSLSHVRDKFAAGQLADFLLTRRCATIQRLVCPTFTWTPGLRNRSRPTLSPPRNQPRFRAPTEYRERKERSSFGNGDVPSVTRLATRRRGRALCRRRSSTSLPRKVVWPSNLTSARECPGMS